VPCDTTLVTEPLALLHDDACGVNETTGDVDGLTTAEALAVQPLADVTVTE